MDPKNLRYAASHEWAAIENGICTIGITKFAVDQLTDVVYIELPQVGDRVSAAESFGEIESVKAVSDLYSSVSGEVTAVNEKVVQDPATISRDPYGNGWLIRVRLESGQTLDSLMTADQYQKQISSESH